jgi:thermostable 8-oxoguanine DNA glycosylase
MKINFVLEKKDVELIQEIYRQFPETKFPEINNFKKCTDEELWQKIIGQIIVIGKDSPYEKVDKQKLSLKSLNKFVETQSNLPFYINSILLEASVRYVGSEKISPKANWISDNFSNPKIVKNEKVVLLDNMKDLLKENKINEDRELEKLAREFIMKDAKGFGLKSASDFLIEIGFAKTLIAFDVRVLEFINQILKPNIPLSQRDLGPGTYLLLEESFQSLLKVGISPSKFDRIIFQNKNKIIEKFRSR